jgi:hypothetical protein
VRCSTAWSDGGLARIEVPVLLSGVALEEEFRMKRSVLSLIAATLSAAALGHVAARPSAAATDQEVDKAPLMASFSDLKWTDLPERKGMQFSVLSGDPKRAAYTQLRRVPAGTDNTLHRHSSELTNVIISGV